MSNPKDKHFKYAFHGLCATITIALTIYCVYQYTLDKDVSNIEFRKYNSAKDRIYPSITLCLPNALLEDKLTAYGVGINTTSYHRFLTGKLWDERMVNIDFDDVSLNIEKYLIGTYNSFWEKYFYHNL